MNFLCRMPNLSHLKLDMLHNGIHAQIWERLIQKHLSKLKNLQFKTNFTTVVVASTREQHVQQIVDTFRNPFWLDEHRWFVQCDWSPMIEKCYVYTLPYSFENFNIDFPICAKSTCAPDNDRCLYDRVRRLTYTGTPHYLYECFTLSHIQFPNVEHITIELPTHNHFRYKNKQYDPLTSSPIPSIDACEANCLTRMIWSSNFLTS